jgi:hypothetical protein
MAKSLDMSALTEISLDYFTQVLSGIRDGGLRKLNSSGAISGK